MALTAKSLFLFGISVTTDNQNIPFKASVGGSEKNAVIPIGYYSLTTLVAAIAAQMNAADPSHVYTVTADRTTSSGQSNRITISTSGTFLSLLFSTGTLAATSIRDLIAFGHTDRTGATTYTNSGPTGTILIPAWWGKNYEPPTVNVKNFGTVNVSTDGTKEAITWSIQEFIGVEYENEPQASALLYWPPLIQWMVQQKPFDFTPMISSPSTVYSVTLEKSSADGKGLGFQMKEQVPQKPFLFTTGKMTMRVQT